MTATSVISSAMHPADVIAEITPASLGGLRVLFINMPLRESARPNTTPEGPLLLATRLQMQYGVEVSIVDLNAYRIQDTQAQLRNLPWGRHLTIEEAAGLIERHIKKFGEPHCVGFSGKITTLRWQKEVLNIVRSLIPDVFIVSGGGLATELKEGLFHYLPKLDGAAHSEGDDVMIKIAFDATIIRKMGIESAVRSNMLAPYYIGMLEGRHRMLYAGNRPLNLDELPHADLELLRADVDGNPVLDWYLQTPAWSASANNSSSAPWNDSDVVPKTTSVSSRGCPFGCKYCFRKTQGERNWGVRSADHIMRELHEHIDRYGIKFHAFPDDNFAVTVDRIREIKNLVPWGTHTRLDEAAGIINGKVEDPLRVQLMAEGGCTYIGFGPESASPSVLKAIGKGGHTLSNGMMEVPVGGAVHSFPTSMIVGIQNALRFNIHSNCTWIFGSPTETLADVQESVLFMQWQMEYYGQFGIKPESVNTKMFAMTWYPGTTLINSPLVRDQLMRVFGLTFEPAKLNTSGVLFDPVVNEKYYDYLISLDDATKVLENEGEPLNFSDIPNDTFLHIRDLVRSDQTLEILHL